MFNVYSRKNVCIAFRQATEMALKIRLGKIEFFTAYYILIYILYTLLPISNYVVYPSSAGVFFIAIHDIRNWHYLKL